MRAQFRLSDLIPAELTVKSVHHTPDAMVSQQVAGVPNAVRPPIAFIAAILG